MTFLINQVLLLALLLCIAAASKVMEPGDLIFPPGDDNRFSFSPIDDRVMGGRSSSRFNGNTWTGTVTDANNGGFVSIRSTPSLDMDMSKCRGVSLKVKSVGTTQTRRFKVGLRDSSRYWSITWNASFDVPANRETTIRIPMDSLVPTRYGRTQRNAGSFNEQGVTSIGLSYSKFEYDYDLNPNFELGQVELKVYEIRAY